MLTADLVQVRIYRGEVRPRYLQEGPDPLGLASRLIDIFAAHVGKPRLDLQDELKDFLGTGTAFLLHRGLAKLLFDRCSFESESPVEPEDLRRAVFEAAAEARREAEHFDRSAVLERVASAFEIETGTIERCLYADLKDEQILQEWKPCTPEWLVRRYNVALAQGVLLRASGLEITIAGQDPRRYRALFRRIKFFQLLHRVTGTAGEGYRIRLDGPMSIFQSTGKYGVRMGSFLPTLLHFDGWTLDADVRWGKRRRKCTFSLSSDSGLRPYGRLPGQWQPEELGWLPDQLAELDAGWSVSTDGELVDLGGQGVLVPDFVFVHRDTGKRVLMDVLGFWNKSAVASRLRLLRRHGPPSLILAISKQLAAGQEGLDDLPAEVYVFRSAPLARQVLKILKTFVEKPRRKRRKKSGRKGLTA